MFRVAHSWRTGIGQPSPLLRRGRRCLRRVNPGRLAAGRLFRGNSSSRTCWLRVLCGSDRRKDPKALDNCRVDKTARQPEAPFRGQKTRRSARSTDVASPSSPDSGQLWHITHRCHRKQFLLKFARDRRAWVRWLYEARKRFGLCVLNYRARSCRRCSRQRASCTAHTVGTVPPSMTYSVPVMVSARSEARKAIRLATSSGFDGRPIGMPPSESMMICLPPS